MRRQPDIRAIQARIRRLPGRQAGPCAPDDCQICSVMHLAGTLVLPPPPQMSLPVPARIFAAAVEQQIDAAAQRQPF